MIYKVGICDDQRELIVILKRFLKAFSNEIEFHITAASDPIKFMNIIKDMSLDIVFLDVEMGQCSGIEVGHYIRSLHKDALIIYITAYEKYAIDAYSVRAFHYLVKPVTQEKFEALLSEVIDHLKQMRSSKARGYFIVEKKNETLSIDYNEILYFEKVGHKVKVCTNSKDYYYYDNLMNLMKCLDHTMFVRCHQGYIVNIDEIRSFQKNRLHLRGDRDLPVSRTHVESVRKVIGRMLFQGETL